MLLVALFVVPAMSTGAFATLWAVDLEITPLGGDASLFQTFHTTLGLSSMLMICSERSQHWYEVWAMWKHGSMHDISDVFALNRAQRTMVFMGYFSFLYLMSKLWPVLTAPAAQWCETIIQSNDLDFESGVTVTMRHSFNRAIWWRHWCCEAIPNGLEMMRCFWTIALPKLRIGNVYAGGPWRPYYQASGPPFFAFMPKGGGINEALYAMWFECKVMKIFYGDNYGVSKRFLHLLLAVYDTEFATGRWLTDEETKQLCEGL